mgnify:CR=1 FL=1
MRGEGPAECDCSETGSTKRSHIGERKEKVVCYQSRNPCDCSRISFPRAPQSGYSSQGIARRVFSSQQKPPRIPQSVGGAALGSHRQRQAQVEMRPHAIGARQLEKSTRPSLSGARPGCGSQTLRCLLDICPSPAYSLCVASGPISR